MTVHFSYECKVRYEKNMENGLNKKTTETYIILDALSFTEAEARMTAYITPYVNGEMEITSIKKSKYRELIGLEDMSADRFFNVKVEFIMIDEKTMLEKRNAINMLVKASNIDDAKQKLDYEISSVMLDYAVVSVSETKIMDVIPLEV